LNLRHPVERTWSQMKMFSRANGTDLSCEKVLSVMLGSEGIISRGFIKNHYLEWKNIFNEKMLTIFIGDIEQRPRYVLSKCCKHLEIDYKDECFYKPHQKVFDGSSEKIPKYIEDHLLYIYSEEILFYEELFSI